MTEHFEFIDCVNIKHYKNKISGKINSDDFLNVIYLNIRSVRNKFTDIKNLMTSYDFIIHILVLSEIHINSNEQDRFQLNNYDAFFSCRDENKGGGVVIYVLSTILSKLKYEQCFCESNLLIVNLPVLNCNVMAVYRPPHVNKNDFLNTFEEIISQHKNMYIIGDFNIDLLKKNDSHVQKYLEILNSCGFVALNKISHNFATRVESTMTRATKTIIDHISTDMFTTSYFLSLHEFFKSDHRLVLFNIKTTNLPSSITVQKKTFFKYENVDMDFTSNRIKNVNNFVDLINISKEIIFNHTETKYLKISLKKIYRGKQMNLNPPQNVEINFIN